MLYIALLVVVCAVSFVYCLLIEMPFTALDKFLMGLVSKPHSKTKPNKITVGQSDESVEMPNINNASDLVETYKI